MNAKTGKPLGGVEHVKQSIADILTTPLGSRVHLREYGSELFELIDAPATPQTRLDVIAATAGAVRTWEPRFDIRTVRATVEVGRIIVDVSGVYLPTGELLELPVEVA